MVVSSRPPASSMAERILFTGAPQISTSYDNIAVLRSILKCRVNLGIDASCKRNLSEIWPEGKAMKNYLFLVCLVFSAHPAYVCAANARIPEPVMEKIEARAASDFPGNKSAQKDTIKTQTDAYSRLNNYSNNEVPAVVLNKIKISTTQYYSHDYSAQLFFGYIRVSQRSKPLIGLPHSKYHDFSLIKNHPKTDQE